MPHGHCYLWEPHILWLHVISDAAIGLAYFSIPIVLMLFSRRRSDLKLNAIFYAFSAFILACGVTHFFSVYTVWNPAYLPEGLLKALTAAISMVTAAALWLVLPRLVALPSPAKLAAANAQLNEEIQTRWELDRQITAQNAELRASNRLLAMREYALDHAAGAIAMADLKANITYSNQAFATLLGVARVSDLVGRNALEFLPEGSAALADLLRNGQWIGEIGVLRPNGETRQAAAAAGLVDFGDDSPKLIMASFLDVTDTRQARSALHESEARLANAQRIAKLGNWDLTLADGSTSWSAEIYHIFGVAPGSEPFDMDQTLALIHPGDRAAVRAGFEKCLVPGNGPASWQFRIVRPDGVIRHASSQAEAVFDAAGKPVRVSGTMQDVTDQVVAESATRRTEAFLDQIIENIPAMLFVKDAEDLRFLTINKSGEELLGVPRSELIGRNDADFFPPDQAKAFTQADRSVLAGRRPVVIPEEVIQTREKGERLLRTIKIPVYDEEDQPLYLLGFSDDITERKQLELQFRQAQKMETVGHLTGGVAHDFNNVLMAMQINLEVVEERVQSDAEASECIRMALGAVQRGADLTARLLAFSRRQPLRPKVVNVNVLIREMMRLLHRALEEDLDVETVLTAGIWSIEVDQAQLENALINLAVNARDAMPEGGKLTIEAGNTRLDDDYVRDFDDVRPGQYVMIAVSDTGQGMEPDVLERAFDPFFTTKDVGKGSGLGLSMVYGFVKQSGGHVKLYSEVGHGTTAKLYFPRVTASAKAAADETPRDIPAGQGVVLLVEDDSSVRRSVTHALRAAGYTVHAAEAGAEAIALVEGGLRPILLLADVVLPRGMSGSDVSAAVNRLVPGCRTLYMSGYTDNAIVHHGRLDPGVVLISKPFTRQALAAKVREVLEAGG
ncbi:PAS domain S-box protein [Emcibacter sp. SYSU 3D8]|uniref:PAS domain-containing hybrid sensor histidine kinase/response regulator n=1 Tax=Emcibacter sp. SYSU 3D8 TaxID=3133969 RepID=UPI0031FEE564